ncbi:sigma-54 interaction domain-containing protein [Desulfosoma sp.]|uniref:sigma-54 interaction domain-containing protein n=1 Tax=Desulfosoma sp. TaxID=2603217 RepID=UPI004049850E
MTEPQIIGISPSIEKIRRLIRRVADVNLTVLITGESGVGKELVARALHYYSSRRDKPFVKVNCAALPGELIESELFGYEKGAFTGADRRKPGKFEAAGEGTIFLDEIGEIPLPMQAKLLQVLQDLKFSRIGGNQEIQSQARVVAATNVNLEAEVSRGRFREDLYFRINTISIPVPPLRERREDLEPLVHFFMKQFKKEQALEPYPVPDSLMELFLAYHWPGNVRELENYLKRLCVLRNATEIREELRRSLDEHPLRAAGDNGPRPSEDFIVARVTREVRALTEGAREFPSLREIRDRAVERVERAILEYVLREVNWNRREAARILKISYRALLYKIKEMNLRP